MMGEGDFIKHYVEVRRMTVGAAQELWDGYAKDLSAEGLPVQVMVFRCLQGREPRAFVHPSL
jgi:hypothetical protein